MENTAAAKSAPLMSPFGSPFKAEYRIIFLSEEYSQTVIGRTKRDYVWIMARKKIIPDEEYENILNFLREQDYDLKDLRVVPHDR